MNKKQFIHIMMATVIYLAFFLFVINSEVGQVEYDVYWDYREVLFSGWIITIVVSTLSVLLSLFVGLVLYFMQQAKSLMFLGYMAEIHKTIIFGTPLIVLAIISYYFIGNAFGIDSRMFIGVMTLGLYIGAYVADIYTGAIESIHINQWQTAKMFGFTRYQTYRYIIFPQVLKSIMPPLAGQFALTIKGSALLSFMALSEFLNEVSVVQAISFAYIEGYVILAIGYWLITVPLIIGVRRFEKRLHVRVIK